MTTRQRKHFPCRVALASAQAIAKALGEKTEPLKWQVITHLLLVSGCQRGEIMGRKWENVDFKQRTVRIRSALLYSSQKGVYEDSTKTKTVRLLRLPQETVALLKKHRKEQRQLQLLNGDRWMKTGYVFTKDNGEARNPESIYAHLIEDAKTQAAECIADKLLRYQKA